MTALRPTHNKSINALVVSTTPAALWTPASGLIPRLMGGDLTSQGANTVYILNGSASTPGTIGTYIVGAAGHVPFNLGNGARGTVAGTPLFMKAAADGTINGSLFGREESF